MIDQQEWRLELAKSGISAEICAAAAKGMNRRQLLCRLRDARSDLVHHGRRSFAGRAAQLQIAAVEAELRIRGIPLDTPLERNLKASRLARHRRREHRSAPADGDP